MLVREYLNGPADVMEALRHEILGQYGLSAFPAEAKRRILDAASKNVPG